MTKTERTNRCKKILNTRFGSIDDQESLDFLIESFEMLPHWDSKVRGQKVVGVEVGQAPAPWSSKRCFYIVREDGSRTDFSIYVSKKINDVKKACRRAIAHIVQNHIEGISFPYRCEITGDIIKSRSDADVDHYDLTFDKLVSKWIAIKGGEDYLYQFVNETKDNESETCFTSQELIDDFVKFHEANTNLRVVSKKANRSILRRKQH